MDPAVINQVWNLVAQYAGQGADTTGQIADFLTQAGYSVGAASQILNGVATSAAMTPQQLAYLQQEMQYLQSGMYQQPRNNWIVPALVLGALWLIARKD